LFYRYPFQV
jgi:acetone carboxylase gamma subunit